MTSNKWVTDAQLSDETFLFKNNSISDFLDSYNNNLFILVASKGMGKTLLLRNKKKIIEDREEGFVLIPKNETADYVELPASVPQDLILTFNDRVFWKDIWQISISISALLNFPHDISNIEINLVKGELNSTSLPAKLKQEILNALSKKNKLNKKPSDILNTLLQNGKSSIEKIRKDSKQIILSLYCRYITSGCFVFIDSFDQALNDLNYSLKIWCSAQTGLMQAAWELSRQNRHTKIFITIRQEAYASFRDHPEIGNLSGNALLIKYSKDDLKNMFALMIKKYEEADSIEDFFGFHSLRNGYAGVNEPVFDYLYRHTICVPRWFVLIGKEISYLRNKIGLINNTKIKNEHQVNVSNVINEQSSVLVSEYIRGGIQTFLPQNNIIERLLTKINSNILSLAHITRLSQKSINKTFEHPFCLLYNIGLLGVVAITPASNQRQQIFNKPYQFNWEFEETLPINPNSYYLLHPSLNNLIQNRNQSVTFSSVIISDGAIWRGQEERKIKNETIRVFISYSSLNNEVVNSIINSLEKQMNQKNVINDIWFDKWSMRGGKAVVDQIDKGISESDFVILMVSKESLDSNYVNHEWKLKYWKGIRNNEHRVIPCIIDDTDCKDLPEYLKTILAYKIKNNEKEAVKSLVEDLITLKEELTNN